MIKLRRSARYLAAALALTVTLGAVSGCASATPSVSGGAEPKPSVEISPLGAPAATVVLPVDMTSQPFVGIYKSILPGASSPGINGTLYVSYDGTTREVNDYLNEDGALVEYGTWALNDDGTIEFTVTGTDDRQYEEPVSYRYRYEDKVLVAEPNEPDASYMQRTWYAFDTLVYDGLAMPYDAESADMAVEEGFAGYYLNFSRSASCCGLDIMLSLHADDVALVRSDYLNGDPAIEEIGTWAAIDATTVEVTLTGTQDRVYEDPVVTRYTWNDGAFTDETGAEYRSLFGYALASMAEWQNSDVFSYVGVDDGVMDQLVANATFDLPDFGEVTLVAGCYERKGSAGASDAFTANLLGWMPTDLNGDAEEDAVAIVVVNTGGTGSFYYLTAFVGDDETLTQSGEAFMGDRVDVNTLTVEGAGIMVDMVIAGPDDPACCPSLHVVREYQWDAGTLTEIGEEPVTQAEIAAVA